MFRLVFILIGYAVGCFQSAYFVGMIMHKDIRKYGSGNLGSTNALRVLGKKAGAATFICDVGKGIIAFAVCYHLVLCSDMIFRSILNSKAERE